MLDFDKAIRKIERRLVQNNVQNNVQDDLGFVATVATHWHALGVEALLEDLRREGDRPSGIVLLMAHPTNGLLLGEDQLPLCRDEPNVEMVAVAGRLPKSRFKAARRAAYLAAKSAGFLATSRHGRRPLRIASPRLPDAFTLLHLPLLPFLRRRSVEFVVLDEGLSSYLPASVAAQVRRPERLAGPKPAGSQDFELWLRRLYDQMHGFFCNRYPQQSRLLFHVAQDGSLETNRELARSYRIAASRLASDTGPLSQRTGLQGPIAMILPQPWSEIGQTDAGAERQLYSEIASQLRSRGYKVYLKPHPREKSGKYDVLCASASARDVQILDQSIPVETLVAGLGEHDMVLGHNTTSLLTAPALSEARAYTLGDILIERGATGDIFGNFQHHFRRLAGKSVLDARRLLRSAA